MLPSIYVLAWAELGLLSKKERLALALLVARVFADHHDPTITADHLALVADLLDARLDLHGVPLRVSSVECE